MIIEELTSHEIDEFNPQYGKKCFGCSVRFIQRYKAKLDDFDFEALDSIDIPYNCTEFLCDECLMDLKYLLDLRRK